MNNSADNFDIQNGDCIADSSYSGRLVPEILAPAGGREQFFAALYSGADAVFLGLKQFNARARDRKSVV